MPCMRASIPWLKDTPDTQTVWEREGSAFKSYATRLRQEGPSTRVFMLALSTHVYTPLMLSQQRVCFRVEFRGCIGAGVSGTTVTWQSFSDLLHSTGKLLVFESKTHLQDVARLLPIKGQKYEAQLSTRPGVIQN